MNTDHYFYNCSREYIDDIDPNMYSDIVEVISKLPKRQMQSAINQDLFWLLTERGWSFDTFPSSLPNSPPTELSIGNAALSEIKRRNNRGLFRTSTTINATWHSDFAKSYGRGLVQIEAQFGKVDPCLKTSVVSGSQIMREGWH